MDPANRADPYPLYARLRERPVARQRDGSYVVSTVCRGDPAPDRVDDPIADRVSGGRPLERRQILRADPPDHDTLRAAVMREFTIPRVQGLRPRVVREVDVLHEAEAVAPVALVQECVDLADHAGAQALDPRDGDPIRDWIINPIRSRIATAHRPLIFRDPPDHDTLRANGGRSSELRRGSKISVRIAAWVLTT
jgi:hypothetical protein